MSVSASQCVCSHNNLMEFFCGICKSLATSPRVHDGGYGQSFCRSIFCNSCTDAIAANPSARTRVHKDGKKFFVCPVSEEFDCNQSFQPPFFRFLSRVEDSEYRDIGIECLKCHVFFNPYDYNVHKFGCDGPDLSVDLPSKRINKLAGVSSRVIKKKVEYMLGYESKWIVKSLNFSSFVYDNTSLSQMPDGFELPVVGKDNTVHRVKKVESSEGFLTGIAAVLGVPVGSIDLVFLAHRTLSQYATFNEFAHGLPSDAPLIIVERREALKDPALCGKWLYLHSCPRRGLSSDGAGSSTS